MLVKYENNCMFYGMAELNSIKPEKSMHEWKRLVGSTQEFWNNRVVY